MELKHWEYQDQKRDVRFVNDTKNRSEFDWGDDLPEGGEGFIACSWHCRDCDEPLASNRETRISGDDEATQAFMELLNK